MENKELNKNQECEQDMPSLHFSLREEEEYYRSLKGQLIKLLYLIEREKAGDSSAELYFYGFIYELRSANILCKNKLTKVCVKIFGLYNDFKYREMSHEEIKRQIFECKGIVDHLIKTLSEKEEF